MKSASVTPNLLKQVKQRPPTRFSAFPIPAWGFHPQVIVVLAIFIFTACTTAGSPEATAVPLISAPLITQTATGANTAAPAIPETDVAPIEAILIQEPGPGSRLTSPLLVRGEADSTFEQNLVVRLVDANGAELGLTAVTIAAEMGQRGPFEASIPFTVSGEQQAFIQVFATSPRDGGVTHLNAVGVVLTDGAAEIRPFTADTAERIIITQPTLAAPISGGVVQVSGVGIASFEQTLVVELVGEDGAVLASQPVIVNAPDLGQPGTFSAALSYSVAGPGRIVVRDISPAFGGDVHVSSVEVMLSP
ncbi:MAG TPA: Gmad2 immunoglobulin-like domain-containing protein [Chloroflexota bacterium]|nr:Gmad2 immunoglobulin-like domain-containing protein [Chloroflexota bacterium]